MSESPPTVTVTIDPSQRVNAPAIALMITGIIGGVLAVLSLALNILGVGMGSMIARESGQDALGMMFSGGMGIAVSLVNIALAAFIIWAATKMKNLQAWPACVGASIIAMIPCVSPCCVLGLPIGIWCLVILFDQKVKAAFS